MLDQQNCQKRPQAQPIFLGLESEKSENHIPNLEKFENILNLLTKFLCIMAQTFFQTSSRGSESRTKTIRNSMAPDMSELFPFYSSQWHLPIHFLSLHNDISTNNPRIWDSQCMQHNFLQLEAEIKKCVSTPQRIRFSSFCSINQ